jgi:hypothetical protein
LQKLPSVPHVVLTPFAHAPAPPLAAGSQNPDVHRSLSGFVQSGTVSLRHCTDAASQCCGTQKFVLQGGHVRKSWDEAPPLELSSGSHRHTPLVAYCWAMVLVVVALPRSRTWRVTSTEQPVLGGKMSGVMKLRTIAYGSLASMVMLAKPPSHVVESSVKNATAGVVGSPSSPPGSGRHAPPEILQEGRMMTWVTDCETPPLPLSLSQSLVTSFPNV